MTNPLRCHVDGGLCLIIGSFFAAAGLGAVIDYRGHLGRHGGGLSVQQVSSVSEPAETMPEKNRP